MHPRGLPTALTKTANGQRLPFGIWFANADTLYVADEGDGYTGGTDLYTHAAAQTAAGLQKWIFNSTTNTWTLAYTLQTGLDLASPTPLPGTPPATTQPRASPGLPQPMASVISPGTSTTMVMSRSGPLPPPSAAVAT